MKAPEPTCYGPRMKLAGALAWFVLGGQLSGLAACGRSEAATGAASGDRRPATGATADCAGHAVCADGFFIDVATPPGCTVGAICSVALHLVAKGDFHINDEYPYRFSADEGPGLRFEGTERAGRNVFSKPAGDWQKTDAKSGEMQIRFTPLEKGSKTIAGTFKLSVCSAEACLLEQRHVSASLVAH